MFSKKGLIVVEKDAANEDKLTEIVLEAGAEDLSDEGEVWEITTAPADFNAVLEAVKAAKIETVQAEVTMIASTYTKLGRRAGDCNDRLLEAIDDLDDTQNVYSNFDMDEETVTA